MGVKDTHFLQKRSMEMKGTQLLQKRSREMKKTLFPQLRLAGTKTSQNR